MSEQRAATNGGRWHSSRTARAFVFCLMLGPGLYLSACSDKRSPEDQVREVVAAAESGAEARDVSTVMELVSDDYQDARGLDKAQVRDFMRGFFVINQSVHLLVRVEDIEFPAEGLAEARVTVGMLGRQQREDWSFAAEIHSFDIRLAREDDEWKLVRADLVTGGT